MLEICLTTIFTLFFLSVYYIVYFLLNSYITLIKIFI